MENVTLFKGFKKFARYRLEIFSALGVLIWGSFLLNPFVDSFVQFPNYGEMAKHATENSWGWGAVIIGILSIVGVMWNNKSLRRAGMLGTLVFRMFTMMSVGLQTNFTSAGTGDFFLWAVIALLAYFRIDHEF